MEFEAQPSAPTAESLETLAERVDRVLARADARRTRAGTAATGRAGRVVHQLVHEALAAGVPVEVDIEASRPGSGSTAEAVLRVRATTPLIFKMDEEPKLLEEARVLQRLQERTDLPPSFRRRFPRIFAVRDHDGYAYLMEEFRESEGYVSSHRVLFPEPELAPVPEQDAVRIVNAVCDALFEGYAESLNTRLRPSVYTDYVERISSRLSAAGKRDDDFASLPVEVPGHGRTYRPWRHYLSVLGRHKRDVEDLAPPFVTFVHGDPNPENVLVAVGQTKVQTRFIDVKGWQDGDYLFDMTKYFHYLLVTGPMELMSDAGSAIVTRKLNHIVVDHRCEPPVWVAGVESALTRRVALFAADPAAQSEVVEPDRHWEPRWQLGMASNLLGLPDNRLAKGQREAALVMYVEGLRYLHDFCDGQGWL